MEKYLRKHPVSRGERIERKKYDLVREAYHQEMLYHGTDDTRKYHKLKKKRSNKIVISRFGGYDTYEKFESRKRKYFFTFSKPTVSWFYISKKLISTSKGKPFSEIVQKLYEIISRKVPITPRLVDTILQVLSSHLNGKGIVLTSDNCLIWSPLSKDRNRRQISTAPRYLCSEEERGYLKRSDITSKNPSMIYGSKDKTLQYRMCHNGLWWELKMTKAPSHVNLSHLDPWYMYTCPQFSFSQEQYQCDTASVCYSKRQLSKKEVKRLREKYRKLFELITIRHKAVLQSLSGCSKRQLSPKRLVRKDAKSLRFLQTKDDVAKHKVNFGIQPVVTSRWSTPAGN